MFKIIVILSIVCLSSALVNQDLIIRKNGRKDEVAMYTIEGVILKPDRSHQKCKFVAATWPRVSFSWLYTLELYQGVMAKPKFHTMSPHMRQLMGEQKSLGSRFRRESRWSFYFGKGQGRAWASYEDDILQL